MKKLLKVAAFVVALLLFAWGLSQLFGHKHHDGCHSGQEIMQKLKAQQRRQ